MFIGKLQAVSDFLDGKAGIPEKEAGGVDFAGQDIFIRRLSVGPAENAGELRGGETGCFRKLPYCQLFINMLVHIFSDMYGCFRQRFFLAAPCSFMCRKIQQDFMKQQGRAFGQFRFAPLLLFTKLDKFPEKRVNTAVFNQYHVP